MRTIAFLAALLIAVPAFAGTLTIDSFFEDEDYDIHVYLTATPDRPASYVFGRCFLMEGDTPIDDKRDMATDVSGPVRLRITFYRRSPMTDPRVECDVEFDYNQ